MRLMAFATVLWMRQLRFKLIYRYEIRQMRHMTYDIQKENQYFEEFFFYGSLLLCHMSYVSSVKFHMSYEGVCMLSF